MAVALMGRRLLLLHLLHGLDRELITSQLHHPKHSHIKKTLNKKALSLNCKEDEFPIQGVPNMVVWTFSESALLLKPMHDTFNKHINPHQI